MSNESQPDAAKTSLADDFATTMPAWMPDGLEDEGETADEADEPAVETAGDDDAAEDAATLGPVAAQDEETGGSVVVLPRQARLPQAEDLVERLTAAIDADDLVIDAREVEEITTPVVTAIIAALNSRADRTPPAAVLAPTPAFVDAFSDLGLFQDLMKMEFRQ